METSHLGLSVPRALTRCISSDCALCICSHVLQEGASLVMAREGAYL